MSVGGFFIFRFDAQRAARRSALLAVDLSKLRSSRSRLVLAPDQFS